MISEYLNTYNELCQFATLICSIKSTEINKGDWNTASIFFPGLTMISCEGEDGESSEAGV